MSKPASSHKSHARSRPRRRGFRALRLGLLLLLIAVLSLTEPNVFRFAVSRAIEFEAWRNGVSVNVGRVEGSLWEPLVLLGSRWTYRGAAGAVTRLEIARAEAQFRWRNFVPGSFDRWFKELTIRGVSGKLALPAKLLPGTRERSSSWFALEPPRGRWMALPERVEARDIDFIVERNGNSLRLEGSRFVASELEPGYIWIGRLTVKQPWLARTFRDVRGTTKLQDSKVLIANVSLEPGVEIRSLSVEIGDLAKGRLNTEIQVAAFGGTIRAEAQTLTHEHPATVEASGTFSQIGIAKLATFLGLSEAAGGTIKEGKFTFRGAPREFEKASASLWMEATNFQWESRQWDSLALGASLMERRIQVSKLDLHQGHNRLDLSGDMAWPMAGAKWWQSEFTCNVAAKIDDLTELSALLLPEFKFAAGQMKIDGSIRARNQQFSGQLIAAGSKIRWRNAPIENLHAAIKLDGNECQISNLEFFNQSDYVRGRGVVNILGATQYWGELRGSIEDLATYAAVLQKPVVPEPLAGGAMIEWSGEGSAKGHSGKFLARLNKVRSLGALAPQLHPINADLEGTYGPGSMQFSNFALSDDESSFTANVGVGNKALSLQKLRLIHGSQIVLEGDALLPLDVWQMWPNTSLATLLNDETASEVKLTATNLDLHSASQLAGWNFPIAGLVNGSLSASGRLAALQLGGKLTLTKGQLPLGWNGDALTEVEATATAQGAEITVEKIAATHRFGSFLMNGKIGFQNARDPSLALQLTSERAMFPIFGGASPNAAMPSFTTSLDLKIDGPASAATVRGEAQIIALTLGETRDLSALWGDAQVPPLPPFFSANALWDGWHLDVACRTSEPIPLTPTGTAAVDARAIGWTGAPVLAGLVRFNAVPCAADGEPLFVEEATLTFDENRSRNPTLDLRATASTLGEPLIAYLAGPLTFPVRWFRFDPPLTEELVKRAFASGDALASGAKFPGALRVSLRVPAPLMRGIDVFEWSPIETPESPEPGALALPSAQR